MTIPSIGMQKVLKILSLIIVGPENGKGLTGVSKLNFTYFQLG
jgi:hypothetical protein